MINVYRINVSLKLNRSTANLKSVAEIHRLVLRKRSLLETELRNDQNKQADQSSLSIKSVNINISPTGVKFNYSPKHGRN